MAITESELGYTYASHTTKGDDPKLRGEPDSSLFNRHEGYEVVYLLNKFATKHNLNNPAVLKAERMIHTHLPSNIRSQANVVSWMETNWSNYS